MDPDFNQKLYLKKKEDGKKKLISFLEITKIGMDLGWVGDDLGTVWGYFRSNFGPILKTLKFASSELKN